MSDPLQELQQLKGIGAVTAGRLIEAGLTTFPAIVSAGEEGLRSIAGINPRSIPAILAQAAELAEGLRQQQTEAAPATPDEDLRAIVEELRLSVQEIAVAARERFSEETADRVGRKLTRNLVATLDALYVIEEMLERRPRRCRKALVKARKRLEELTGAEPEQTRKGLKRARKALERVTA